MLHIKGCAHPSLLVPKMFRIQIKVIRLRLQPAHLLLLLGDSSAEGGLGALQLQDGFVTVLSTLLGLTDLLSQLLFLALEVALGETFLICSLLPLSTNCYRLSTRNTCLHLTNHLLLLLHQLAVAYLICPVWIWKAEGWIINLYKVTFKLLHWNSLARAEAEEQKHPKNEREELLSQKRDNFPNP